MATKIGPKIVIEPQPLLTNVEVEKVCLRLIREGKLPKNFPYDARRKLAEQLPN